MQHAAVSRPARGDNDDMGMFGEFDGGVEGTHQAILDDAGDGEWAAGLASEMGFERGVRGVGRELRRGQWWLGGNLLVFCFSRSASLIWLGGEHECCLSVGGNDEDGCIVHV